MAYRETYSEILKQNVLKGGRVKLVITMLLMTMMIQDDGSDDGLMMLKIGI